MAKHCPKHLGFTTFDFKLFMVVGIQKHLTVTLFFIAQVKEAVVENMGRSLEGSRERVR